MDLNKQKILDEWIVNNSSIAQHSMEWYKMRMQVIGGSEIATFAGFNPYCTKDQLRRKKIGEIKFEGSPHTRWGTLFEPVIRTIVESELECTISGDKCYVVNPPFSYSPDGLAVINDNSGLQRWHLIDDDDENNNSSPIVLFEFKCPISRVLNGKVPSYYIPQVQQGLAMIPITEFGIFAEAKFIKLESDYMPEFGNNKPITIPFRRSRKEWVPIIGKASKTTALPWRGYITWSVDATDPTLISLERIKEIFVSVGQIDESTDVNGLMFDLCQLTDDEFDFVISQLSEFSYDVLLTTETKSILEIESSMVVLIPFILSSMDMHRINPSNGFIERLKPEVNRFIESINNPVSFSEEINDDDSDIYRVKNKRLDDI